MGQVWIWQQSNGAGSGTDWRGLMSWLWLNLAVYGSFANCSYCLLRVYMDSWVWSGQCFDARFWSGYGVHSRLSPSWLSPLPPYWETVITNFFPKFFFLLWEYVEAFEVHFTHFRRSNHILWDGGWIQWSSNWMQIKCYHLLSLDFILKN